MKSDRIFDTTSHAGCGNKGAFFAGTDSRQPSDIIGRQDSVSSGCFNNRDIDSNDEEGKSVFHGHYSRLTLSLVAASVRRVRLQQPRSSQKLLSCLNALKTVSESALNVVGTRPDTDVTFQNDSEDDKLPSNNSAQTNSQMVGAVPSEVSNVCATGSVCL